jgi:hypothetical protein
MEVGWLNVELCHLGVGDFDTLLVGIVVEPARDGEASISGRVGDQLNDNLMADQWFATPVLSDEGEQAGAVLPRKRMT